MQNNYHLDVATAAPGTGWRRYLTPLKPGRGVLLWGGQIRRLAAAAAAWGVAKGAKVLVVDAANRFDPYALVHEGKSYGLSPRGVLSRVLLSRAFTSHQLVRLFQEAFPAFLEPGALVLLLGPVSLFYDEQVPLAERRRLFRELVQHLAALKAQAALLLLQPKLPKAAANRQFGRLLAPLIDAWVEVEGGEGSRANRLPPAASPPSRQPSGQRAATRPAAGRR